MDFERFVWEWLCLLPASPALNKPPPRDKRWRDWCLWGQRAQRWAEAVLRPRPPQLPQVAPAEPLPESAEPPAALGEGWGWEAVQSFSQRQP